jgi:asparagine synthase (glutamine-hydrolysing)
MFENIFKLLPGHYLIYSNGEFRTERYWDLTRKYHTSNSRPENLVDEFEHILQESVKMRLMSEVPLGVFLSGGIDSSVIVALMSKVSNSTIKTFSVGYTQGSGINEFNYARLASNEFRTEHHEVSISSQDFFDFVPRLVWHLDEPISDPTTIPLFYLSQFAKQHVTVVLSGEGADEILAGYHIYKKMLLMEKFRKLPVFLRNDVFLNLLELFPSSDKLRNYIHSARLPLDTRYWGVSRVFNQYSLQKLCPQADFSNRLGTLYSNYYTLASHFNVLDQMLFIDLNTWLPDDLLMKADKMTMAASQELRVPFLDHFLVEFSFSLPTGKKLHNNVTKYILREIARGMIPQAIIDRPKKGFPIPINKWFKEHFGHTARNVLLDRTSACNEYFDGSYIASLIDSHISGRGDFSEHIWNLIVFEYWHNLFVKKTAGSRQ